MGAFDVVQRPITVGKRGPRAVEEKPARHPMDGFVDVSDQNGGLMICAAGINEYEVKDDAERTIAITLLRAAGWPSRDDLKTRNGHAGPGLPTPGAQCPGEHVFRYCVIPHAGNWEKSLGWKETTEFLHPVRSVTLPLTAPSFEGNRPIIVPEPPLTASASLLSIESDAMMLSAVKKAEERDSLIVRTWNIGTKPVKAEFKFGRDIQRAYRVNLAEKRLKRLDVKKGNVIAIPCKPKQIITVEALF